MQAFYGSATPPHRHLAGHCRQVCQYLAGLRPDRALPGPALPRHDATIVLVDLIATLGRASPRRRLPMFQWRYVSMPPSQRLTWSPRRGAWWGFAPTSLVFWNGWGLRPDSASAKVILNAQTPHSASGSPAGTSGGLIWSSREARFRPRRVPRGLPGRPQTPPGDCQIPGRPMEVRLHKPTGAICVAYR